MQDTKGSAIDHGSLVRQWKWPLRMIFWWLMIGGCLALYAIAVQYWWAWRAEPSNMGRHAEQVLRAEEAVLATTRLTVFDPVVVADTLYTAVYGNVIEAAVGIARAIMNWPANFKARRSVVPQVDEGRRYVDEQLVAFGSGLAVASMATRIWAVRTAIFLSALPSIALCMSIGIVDGLVMRARRKACAGSESASLYHRAKLGQTFVASMTYLVCLGLPSFAQPTLILLPLAVVLAALARLQWTYYKKYL
ncbi:MAG: DUF4400 domain-containing protein [Rubrivivax sp.]